MTFGAVAVSLIPAGNMAVSIPGGGPTEGDGDTGVYLQLLSEFKDYDQYLGIDSSSVSATQLKNLRNPFTKPETHKYVSRAGETTRPPGSNLKLSGVLWDKDAPSVIINGKVMPRDGQIHGFRISEILPTKAILTGNDQRITLELPKKANRSIK